MRHAIGDMQTIAGIVLTQRQTLMTLALASVVLVPLASVAARRARWSWSRVVAAGLAGLGAALVIAVTIGRYDNGFMVTWGRGCLLQPGLSLTSPEEQLNVVLFGPVCFFATIAWRRPLPVLALTVALSAFVEAVQSATGIGTCQTSDIVRNVGGGALAVLVALGCLALVSWRPAAPEAERQP